jgi:hypothetical protein
MRNRILTGSLLFALGTFSVVGCGGGGDDQGGGVDDGKGGSTGKGGNGNSGTGGVIPLGGTTGAGGNTGNGGNSGNTGTGGACVDGSIQGNRSIVALYFMVDISGSMNCHIPEVDPPCTTDPNDDFDTTRWTEASPALQAFFSSSGTDGMLAGINFFSQGGSCDADDYVDPEVEIALLPGNANAINNAIMNVNPSGSTPTVPSLTGAIEHAQDWANANDDQTVVVVYMTDGYPLGCNGGDNTIANAASIAQQAYTGSPSIRTFVLGIGPNLTDLNQIADSGGTDQAIFINTGADVGQQLIDALNAIREDVVVDCAYNIPPAPAGQTIDLGTVNVRITTSDGDEVVVGRDDPSASGCNGWTFDDPANPRQIILCGDACDTVQGDPESRFDVIVNCSGGPIIEPP